VLTHLLACDFVLFLSPAISLNPIMMNRTILLVFIALLLGACASSSRLMQRGNYDAAIEKAVRNLRKNPNKEKEILVLERAYRIANEQNLERIRFLKREGNPRSMPEIVDLYIRMKNRQTLVRTVTPIDHRGRTIQFPYVDYDDEIISARSSAAAYHYDQATQLLERREKMAYREAYTNLVRAIEYGGDYLNARELADYARTNGISRALVTVENHTHLNLPQAFVDQLLIIDTRRMDNEWVEFHYRDLDETQYFDYFIVVNLRMIQISPDKISEKDKMVKKQLEDGFDYALDARGNVKKDSLGNDIKIPRYKEVSCALIETLQQKAAVIEGDVEFLSEQPRRLLKREPLGASTSFEHLSARAIGDLRALDEEARKLVEVKPIPFPTEGEMIMRTADSFRLAIANAIRSNRRIIQ
jgi:hypothetical protein